MQKLKIPYTFRGDIAIVQQQIDEAIKKTLEEMENSEDNKADSNFKQLKPIIERRLQEFYLNCSAKFRGLVQYSKSQERDLQKVVLEPDENLQKINQVKTSMLRESILKAQREPYPQARPKLQIAQPQNLNVVHFQNFKSDIKESIHKNYDKVPCMERQLALIGELQGLVIGAVGKLEGQVRVDGAEIGGQGK